jgi:general secretion pathway protein E
LYAALQRINSKDRNVLTLEDPIEYQLEGISQTQVSDKKGMTFASGLRSVLRQDPDIIMVGEVRDRETAVMAIQSALTGHMVFSTLHTNDAASAITRLLDLGIEPYLVASSVVAILAQRLVRTVCSECGEAVELSGAEWSRLGVEPSRHGSKPRVRRGSGCARCRQTGYRGRIGIFELLVVDDQLRREIQVQANAAQVRSAAVAQGMRLLRDDGVAKILAGMTTVEEVIRVTMRTSL